MSFKEQCLVNICLGGRYRARTCDLLLVREGQSKTLWPFPCKGFSTKSLYLQDLVAFH